jgi:hypothetical protein
LKSYRFDHHMHASHTANDSIVGKLFSFSPYLLIPPHKPTAHRTIFSRNARQIDLFHSRLNEPPGLKEKEGPAW